MTAGTLLSIPVDRIDASPDQNRTEFCPVALASLAESIRENGLLQPIVVREVAGLIESRYVLIGGERRLRACRDVLGLAEVDAIVREAEPIDAAILTLEENLNRVDPGPLEEAKGLKVAGERYGLEGGELARRLGKSPRWVRDRLALLRLADDVAHWVQAGTLPIGRAVLLADLDANRQRLAVQAHERGIGPDAFRALVARLADEQSADAMFDPDDFMRVDEYVCEAEAESAAGGMGDQIEVVREAPVGMAEIAHLLEVRPGTVAQWRQRGTFPDPDLVVSGSPLWWSATVTGWARDTGRA